MTNILHAGFTGCAALLLATLLTAPAEARIECRGNFQITEYGLNRHPLLRGRTDRLRSAELARRSPALRSITIP